MQNYDKSRGWALDRVHNSRRPLDHLKYVFARNLVTLTFDLSTQNYITCRLSQDHSLQHHSFLSYHSDRQTHSQTWMNVVLPRRS